MQGGGPFALDQPQALGIIAHHEAIARSRCRTAGHEDFCDFRILRKLAGCLGNRAGQIMRDGKTARGKPDRRLDNVSKRQLAVPCLHVAPAGQVAWNRDRGGADDIAAPFGVHMPPRLVRNRLVDFGMHGRRRGRQGVDHYMCSVGHPKM
jgi:hypothetical protein